MYHLVKYRLRYVRWECVILWFSFGHADPPLEENPDPEFENFKRFVKNILAVPKEELDGQRAEQDREREERQAG